MARWQTTKEGTIRHWKATIYLVTSHSLNPGQDEDVNHDWIKGSMVPVTGGTSPFPTVAKSRNIGWLVDRQTMMCRSWTIHGMAHDDHESSVNCICNNDVNRYKFKWFRRYQICSVSSSKKKNDNLSPLPRRVAAGWLWTSQLSGLCNS